MTVSSALRGPLHNIFGMTEALLATELTQSQRVQAETVRRNAERLLVLLEEPTDASELARTRRYDGIDEFDLHELVDDVTSKFVRRAAPGTALASVVDDSVPRVVRGDQRPLREILVRFLGTAVRTTRTGRVMVRASTGAQSSSHVTVRVSIGDAGVPVEADERRPASVAPDGRWALSLAVAKQLAPMIDGDVGIESHPERAPGFWFTATFARDPRAETPGSPDGPRPHAGRAMED